jgi:hypothetical protein
VRLAADGSSAAFVPARRAMAWQLTDPTGEPVVRERNWVTFQPGEIRTCAACHGVNAQAHGGLATPTNKPEALRELLRHWKTLQAGNNPPATPVRFAATTSGTNRAHLSWKAGSGDESAFRIERAPAAGGPFVPVITVGGGAFHYTDGNLAAGGAQFYRVVALNANGESSPTTAAAVTIGASADTRLLNISTRAPAGTGDETLIAGFAISGGSPRRLLVRAVGPTLGGLGVTDFMADPELEVFSADADSLGANDDWSEAELVTTAEAVGAFALDAGSKDAATILDLAPGSYTVHARPKTGVAGIALIEVYDASSGTAGSDRLVNISTRGRVGTDSAIMIPGFVVAETQPRLVLIRGVGPSLAGRGVSGVLADPVISVYAGSTLVAQSVDWHAAANADEIAAEAERLGAFPLEADSADDALLITLAPGTYTVHVTGVGGTTGIALCEVYAVE